MFCKHVCCEEERKKERKKEKENNFVFLSLVFTPLPSKKVFLPPCEGLTPLVVGIIETHKTSGVVIIIFSEEERKKMGGEGGA